MDTLTLAAAERLPELLAAGEALPSDEVLGLPEGDSVADSPMDTVCVPVVAGVTDVLALLKGVPLPLSVTVPLALAEEVGQGRPLREALGDPVELRVTDTLVLSEQELEGEERLEGLAWPLSEPISETVEAADTVALPETVTENDALPVPDGVLLPLALALPEAL